MVTVTNTLNHGYEPQRKFWGIIPSALRDCSTYQFHYATLSELEFHNKDQEDKYESTGHYGKSASRR
jgi:hypothetical protein